MFSINNKKEQLSFQIEPKEKEINEILNSSNLSDHNKTKLQILYHNKLENQINKMIIWEYCIRTFVFVLLSGLLIFTISRFESVFNTSNLETKIKEITSLNDNDIIEKYKKVIEFNNSDSKEETKRSNNLTSPTKINDDVKKQYGNYLFQLAKQNNQHARNIVLINLIGKYIIFILFIISFLIIAKNLIGGLNKKRDFIQRRFFS